MDRAQHFGGSIPQIYDRYLVPMLFESYADDLARRAAALVPAMILELAAGTGVLTRAMASRLNAQITATDLNSPMLELAVERQPCSEWVVWRQADAQSLPFDDALFDVVACQFGVMFFPDKIRAYREVRRVLQTSGTFLFNVWEGLSGNGFAETVAQAIEALFPGDPPRFLAQTPHGYHDLERIREDLAAAGMRATAFDRVGFMSRCDSALNAAMAYCQGTPLRNEIELRAPADLGGVTAAVAEALAHRFGPGPIEGETQALIVEARPA